MSAAVVLLTLGGRSLWVDEAFTWTVASVPTDRFLQDLAYNGGNMSLYLALMRLWVTFGDSDWWLRLPSACFAVASVPAVHALARRLMSATGSLVATAALALSAPVLLHAQEARSYSLAVLLTILSWLAVVRVRESDSRRGFAWYLVAAGCLVYAHMIGLLFVGAQILWLFAYKRGVALAAAGCLAAICSPQFVLAFGPAANSPSWIAETSATSLLHALAYLTGTTGLGAAAIVGFIWCLGAYAAARRGTELLLVPVVWLVLPLAGLLLVSELSPMFLDRYLVMGVPGAALLLGVLWDTEVPVARVLATTALLLPLPGLLATASRTLPDWQAATDFVVSHGEPDEVVLPIRSRELMERYWEQHGRPSTMPAPLSSPMAWGKLRRGYDVELARARQSLRSADGAWIVERVRPFALTPEEHALIAEMERRWPTAQQWNFDNGEIRITHYTR